MTENVVFIGGTWSGELQEGETQWWEYWKPTFAREFCDHSKLTGFSFQWTGDLKVTRWSWKKPWEKAADRLKWTLMEAHISRPVIVAHSHGGNVALHALARGVECSHLITLGTPPRVGVPTYKGRWTHVVGTRDWTTRFGMLLDGRVSTATTHKDAHNIVVKKESHSSIRQANTWHKHKLWERVL
jgi:hypothetical protein|tara:strand:+ start:701 stop:1255 length:555 start_codon:yes stop_codon:yes gene_type:complete